MAVWYLSDACLSAFLRRGDFDERLVACPVGDQLEFRRLRNGDGTGAHEGVPPPDFRRPRGPSSAKPFYFPPRELVARYTTQPDQGELKPPRRLIVGARPCELRALGFLDRVFGGPPVEDPVYRAHRSQTLIISVDCATPHETCFCSLVEGRPYAETNFDVNLTPVPGGYVVEAGSEAGHEYLKGAQDLVSSATEAQSRGRDETRTAAASQLEKQNADRAPSRSPADVLGGTENDDRWQELSAGCVECGACTQICPTCHCFFLNDRASGHEGYERLRAWDSCMWSGYSRMAGAERMKPNPRPQFRTRFANRYLHKFVWAPQQWDTLGCVGCGRCVEACPGKIDIRSVLQEAVA